MENAFSIKLRKALPRLVLTFLLYGRLNQMILSFRLFFGVLSLGLQVH